MGDSSSTPSSEAAHLPFIGRGFGAELRLAQRFYRRVTAQSAFANFGAGFFNSSTQAIYVVPHPVTMRATPTFSYSAPAHFGLSALAQDVAGIDVSRLSGTTSGATAGQGTNLQANATTAAWVAFDADL